MLTWAAAQQLQPGLVTARLQHLAQCRNCLAAGLALCQLPAPSSPPTLQGRTPLLQCPWQAMTLLLTSSSCPRSRAQVCAATCGQGARGDRGIGGCRAGYCLFREQHRQPFPRHKLAGHFLARTQTWPRMSATGVVATDSGARSGFLGGLGGPVAFCECSFCTCTVIVVNVEGREVGVVEIHGIGLILHFALMKLYIYEDAEVSSFPQAAPGYPCLHGEEFSG